MVVVVEVVALLQHGHHRVAGDRAKLVGEGAVEDQDVHREDPLADGSGVLQDEALVDEEDAAWRGGGGVKGNNRGGAGEVTLREVVL